MIFSQEHRSILRQQHPNLDNRAISKLLGDRWSKLAEDEKRVYYDRANQVRNSLFFALIFFALKLVSQIR